MPLRTPSFGHVGGFLKPSKDRNDIRERAFILWSHTKERGIVALELAVFFFFFFYTSVVLFLCFTECAKLHDFQSKRSLTISNIKLLSLLKPKRNRIVLERTFTKVRGIVMLAVAISLFTNCAELHILSVFPCHIRLCKHCALQVY